MSVLKRLHSDTIAARKAAIGKPANDPAKKRADLLQTLAGEVQMVGKNDGDRETTEDEAVALIRKFLKGVEENLKHRPGHPVLLAEKEVLEAYLPLPLEEDVVRAEIALLAADKGEPLTVRDTRMVTEALELKFPGRVQGKVVSAILREPS